MLVFDFVAIGNQLYTVRKSRGMTQAEVAEAAGVSDRTYADIERGSVNMRVETMLRICRVLGITPNDILVEMNQSDNNEDIWKLFDRCTEHQKETALALLSVYLHSL